MNTTTTATRIDPLLPASRPFYTRLAALGFVFIALTGLLYLAFNLPSTSAGEIGFLAAFIIFGTAIAGALLRWGAWAQVLAALLSLLLLLLVVPFSIFNLLHPESAADFVPLMLLAVGTIFGLIGSVVSLIQRVRHTLRAATRTESLALRIVLGCIMLLAVLSLALTATARTSVSVASKVNAIQVELRDARYSPSHLEAKAGQTIRIVVRNDDATLHTYTFDQAGVDVSIPPGAERLIEFQAPASGVYQWYCIPHSDPSANGRTGMFGTLTVE